jgi:RNA recognition motif-containing protein
VKLFVSNFAEDTTTADVAKLFERFGPVIGVRMRMGKKRRHAVVEMRDMSDAETARIELDDQEWHGQLLEVQESWW